MSEGGIPLEEASMIQESNQESLPKAFAGSELVRLTEAQRKGNGFSVILFSDIDNTYLRKGGEVASNKLTEKRKEEKIPTVAVTGNSFELDGVTPGVLKRMESGELPYFEAIAGAVGTELYVLHVDANGIKTYKKDEDFEREMLRKGFNRVVLNKSANEMVDNFKTSHQDWSLVFQKPEVEEAYLRGEKVDVQPFKISFHAFASSKEEVNIMQGEIALRFPNEKVVICEEINYNDSHPNEARRKYAIDILPVTKADVVEYIGQIINPDIKVVAGDSGNDKLMLTGAGDISISVGGSKKELQEAIQDATQDSSGQGSFKRVKTSDGKTKYYYSEKGDRLGPESIIRAGEILKRAQRRFKPQLSKVPA